MSYQFTEISGKILKNYLCACAVDHASTPPVGGRGGGVQYPTPTTVCGGI